MLNIAVIFGGKSCEHDISVITGVLTVNSLDKQRFNPIPIYADRDGLLFTGKGLEKLASYSNFTPKKYKRVTFVLGEQNLKWIKGKALKNLAKIDCVINCCHGLNGEDGSISGMLRLCNIALASPDIFCSSFAMDKHFTKLVLKGLKIPTLPYQVIKKEELESGKVITSKIPFPIIVKPANLGSSIGIEKVESSEKFIDALKRAFVYDNKVIIEKMLDGFTEINCACYKGEEIVVSQCEKPISSGDILSFSDKYAGKGKREFPANIEAEISEKIKEYTKKIYTALDFNGIIRIDYLVCDKKIYLNEINTVPGSLAYYLFAQTISEFAQILEKIILNSLKNKENYNKNRYNFTSSVLTNASNIKK